MIVWQMRSLVELALVKAGTHERQVRQREFAGDRGFDTTSMPYKQSKVYTRRRRPASLDLVVGHVTDVPGGFAVSKKAIARWTRALQLGTVPPALLEQLPDLTDLPGNARRLGLWERYRNVAYHRIGAANGDNVRNHPLSFRTKHGNKGNDGAGWALDVGHDEDLVDWQIETGRSSLASLFVEMHEASGDEVRYAPHRVFSAMRRDDTNWRVHKRIVVPTVARFDFARIDYEIAVDRGRPVPRKWDDNALYDYRGRRL